MPFLAPALLLLPGCGNAPPAPEPDPREVERFLATLESKEALQLRLSAAAEERDQKALKAEAMVKTLDRSLPEDVTDVAAESMFRGG